MSLFGEDNEKIDWEYDEETKAYIPSAVAEYAPVNWWEVPDAG